MLVEQSGTGDLVAFVVRYMPCSACHHAYSADDVAVIRHSAGSWVLSATCALCQRESVFTAFDSPPYARMPDMGMVDLPPLMRDDVLSWSHFLEQFQGDFTDLLETNE